MLPVASQLRHRAGSILATILQTQAYTYNNESELTEEQVLCYTRLVSIITLTNNGITALNMGQPCRKP